MNTMDKFSLDKRPLFSIIMPSYNSEEYIERSIQSCINQTFENWELIIINDGSTDNTLNIVNSYISRDNRICVFSKENGGYISAVNYGLNYVKGVYFMFLGSDDEISPSLFYEIYQCIEVGEKPDLIGFRTLISKADKTTRNDENSNFNHIAQAFDSNIKEFAGEYPQQSSIFFTRDTSKLFKTEKLGTLRYFGKKGMDADGIFSMMFAHRASSFLCVPTLGYIWHLRSESLSGRKKDYQTQIDRINNWVAFGNEVMLMDPSSITQQEKYYLINYFFSIVRSVYFSFCLDCLNNGVVEKVKVFLSSVINFFDDEMITREIKFFLNHTSLWKCYIFPKIFFEKISKHIRKIIYGFRN